MKTAILFFSHIVNQMTLIRYDELARGKPADYDLYWVIQTEGENLHRLPEGINAIPFKYDDLSSLGYTPIHQNHIIGCSNFIVERFFLSHPYYDYVWTVEYDVMFTGKWELFFDAFENNRADLLSSHIESYSKANSDWPWWHPAIWGKEYISMGKRIKSFNPIYRLSAAALTLLDELLRKSNAGHYEMFVPTMLHHHGLSLCDIGGDGRFTPIELRNKFYVSDHGINNGTMRYRPLFSEKYIEALGIKNRLFHPVKF